MGLHNIRSIHKSGDRSTYTFYLLLHRYNETQAFLPVTPKTEYVRYKTAVSAARELQERIRQHDKSFQIAIATVTRSTTLSEIL